MIRFACSSCQRVLEAPETQAGYAVACPFCNNKFQVPAPHELHQAPSGHVYDKLLRWLRLLITADFLKSSIRIMTWSGHYGITVAMIAGFLFSAIVAAKGSGPSVILFGLAGIFLLSVLQYTAFKLSGAIDTLVSSSLIQMSSTAYLDCFALLNLVLGMLALIVLSYTAISNQVFVFVVWGIVLFILFVLSACVAVHPKLIGVSFSPNVAAGEEAIGIISINLKIWLRLLPIIFGTGIILNTLGLLLADVMLVAGKLEWVIVGIICSVMIVVCSALPFMSYVFFMFYYLFIDVIRSIIVVPAKLDKLAGTKEKSHVP